MSILDCKTVGFFFLKISKEISKACLVPDLLFDCSRVLEYAKILTVLRFMSIRKQNMVLLRSFRF